MKKTICPFCNEPSFISSSEENQYFCFSCGMGGDRLSYSRAFNKISYKDAGKRTKVQLLFEDDRTEEKNAIYEALSEAAKYFHSSTSSRKNSYLIEERKLNEDVVKRFELGYADGGKRLYHHLQKKGISEETMMNAGLLCIDEETGEMYDKFWRRIIFPIHDEEGRVIGFGGRAFGDKKPKYINSAESIVFDKSHNLYAFHLAKNSPEDYFLLAEGYVDVIKMHQHGFSNAIASLGTSFTVGQAELISKYKKKVYVVNDTDGPGMKAAEKTINLLLKEGIEVKVVSVTPYKDVDEFLVKEGSQAFEDRLKTAVDGKKFLVKQKSPEEVAAFLMAEF